MERLQRWFYTNVQHVNTKFKRSLWYDIQWENRLIILLGARGVGKTTLLLQYIKEKLPISEETIYVSLDDIYFSNHSLIQFTEEFVKRGGKFLILDEAQKYKNWAIEVKNIYDNFPEIKIIVSGSSAIELLKSEADLSRRAIYYNMKGLSFREFLNYTKSLNFRAYTLEEILNNKLALSLEVNTKIKPIKEFETYLKYGYYPFFKENRITYHKRLAQIINTVLEVDLLNTHSIDINATLKTKKLLAEIAEMVPFKPNVKKLSTKIGVSRDSLIKYLKLLENADIINMIYSETKGMSALNKPEKIYLNNPNIAFSLNDEVNTGSLRESFFVNQIRLKHQLNYTRIGDFLVDNKYTFEVGGRNKSKKQIATIKNSWVVADNIELSIGNKIPLWLFGFTY